VLSARTSLADEDAVWADPEAAQEELTSV
jgi:hypothetical protein